MVIYIVGNTNLLQNYIITHKENRFSGERFVDWKSVTELKTHPNLYNAILSQSLQSWAVFYTASET